MNDLRTCRCGAEFRDMYNEGYKICLDCRSKLSDSAKKPTGINVSEWMATRVGFRIVRGFALLRTSGHYEREDW